MKKLYAIFGVLALLFVFVTPAHAATCSVRINGVLTTNNDNPCVIHKVVTSQPPNSIVVTKVFAIANSGGNVVTNGDSITTGSVTVSVSIVTKMNSVVVN
jgi:hypothetical protein